MFDKNTELISFQFFAQWVVLVHHWEKHLTKTALRKSL